MSARFLELVRKCYLKLTNTETAMSSRIFFPDYCLQLVRQRYPKLIVLEELTMGSLGTLLAKGYIGLLPGLKSPKEMFGEHNCRDVFRDNEGRGVTFVTPFTKEEWEALHSRVSVETEGKSKFFPDNLQIAVNRMVQIATNLAIVSNRSVTLHLPERHEFPVLDEPGHIHLVLNASPPGDTTTQSIGMLGDIALAQGSYVLGCAGPTKGRGVAVPFEKDFTIAQIVGSVGQTVYLFLPTNDDCLSTYANEYENPFRVAVQYAWKAMLENIPAAEQLEVVLDDERWLKVHSSIPKVMLENSMAEVARHQGEIEQLQKRLANAFTMVRLHQSIVESIEVRAKNFDPKKDLELIKGSKYIERATYTTDEQVHYYSKPVIVADDAGALRDLGSFVVRIARREVSIWATRTTHPKLVPHPHINIDGAICFGNVTSEVARLCGEFRNAEAAVLIFQWLFEGYDRALTHHKIEEWPLAKKGQA